MVTWSANVIVSKTWLPTAANANPIGSPAHPTQPSSGTREHGWVIFPSSKTPSLDSHLAVSPGLDPRGKFRALGMSLGFCL